MDVNTVPSHFELAQSAFNSYINYTFSVNECEVLVEHKHDHQIIAIRGTEGDKILSGLGFMDIIRDIRFFPWYNSVLGWCHAGFLKGAMKIVDEIENHTKCDCPIVLTGHSLGAALALLVGILLKNRGYDVVEYVGFACPRVFMYNKQRHNPDKNVRFPMSIYRYENDIVPIVPVKFPFGYHHPVVMTQIGDGDGIPSFSDHSMTNYLHFMESDATSS